MAALDFIVESKTTIISIYQYSHQSNKNAGSASEISKTIKRKAISRYRSSRDIFSGTEAK